MERYRNRPGKCPDNRQNFLSISARTFFQNPPEIAFKNRQNSRPKSVRNIFRSGGTPALQKPLFVLKKTAQAIEIARHGVLTTGVQVGVRNLDPKMFLASWSGYTFFIGPHGMHLENAGIFGKRVCHSPHAPLGGSVGAPAAPHFVRGRAPSEFQTFPIAFYIFFKKVRHRSLGALPPDPRRGGPPDPPVR